MDHDSDFEELLRTLDGLIQAQNDKVGEDMTIIVSFVRQKPIRPYAELDDLAASLAFSTLPSTESQLGRFRAPVF